MSKAQHISISEDDILAYERDGVVCLRRLFDPEFVEKALATCLAFASSPAKGLHIADDKDGGSGRTIASSHMARHHPQFMDLAQNSPAAEIAARLMRLQEVRFFYDQLFMKEPGTMAPTAWHNDLPFWPFDGNHIASVWIALTPVTMESSGLVYVAGSHKWGKMYRPDPATPREDFLRGEALHFEPCPMFHKEFDNPEYTFLNWDMEPGDCLVHHPLTVHGAGKNASLKQRRVALSIRYFGGDALWAAPRTAFMIPGTENEPGLERGTFPANPDLFPVVWKSGL